MMLLVKDIMIVCTICGIKKPNKDFYFVAGKKAQKGKRRCQCKQCCADYKHNNKEKYIDGARKYMRDHPHRSWASSVLSSHRKRHTVKLTLDELERMALKTVVCPICGVELDYSRLTKNYKSAYNSPSLDRKNNSKIITKHNSWIICKECNTTKGSKTFEQFINYCKMVGDKFGN